MNPGVSGSATARGREKCSAAGPSLVDRIVRERGPSLRGLARRLRAEHPGNTGVVVLLTGSRRGVGCTTAVLALARAAAEEQAVFLIDGDWPEPGLSARLGEPVRLGWEDALRGLCPPADVVLRQADPPLSLLPLRGPIAEAPALLASPAWEHWQVQFRRDYDLVLVDGGSVWDGGVAWAPWADVALVVCDSGHKLAEDWAQAWDRLEEGGARVLGIIETLG